MPKLLLALLVALGPAASAQVGPGSPEGASSTTASLLQTTLRDLDRGLGTAPDEFVVDDASGTFRFERRFAGPKVINFGPHVPGPDIVLGRCKSFVLDFAGATSQATLFLWISRAEAGNTLHFDLRNGGTSVQVVDHPIPAGSAPYRLVFALFAVPLAPFDEVRVSCTGPVDGGAFHGAIDNLFLGIADTVPSPYCGEFNGGGNTPCPCGNVVAHVDQEGCLSSRGFGARLRSAGTASLSSDTVELLCQQVPSSAAMLVQGSPFVQTGVVFGDGVGCLGGNLVRITTRPAFGGELHYPDPGDAPLSTFVGTAPGTTSGYQVVYRNAAPFCTTATFNVSDTQPVTWAP